MTQNDSQSHNDNVPVPEPEYDDGLVHDHSWACSERGAPAR